MGKKKLIQIADAAAPPTTGEYLIGTKDNGVSGSQDFKYTPAQLAAGMAPNLFEVITIGADGDTITDAYFTNTIRKLEVSGQTLFVEQDFTQSGTTITLLNGNSVYAGLKIGANI